VHVGEQLLVDRRGMLSWNSAASSAEPKWCTRFSNRCDFTVAASVEPMVRSYVLSAPKNAANTTSRSRRERACRWSEYAEASRRTDSPVDSLMVG